jgi:uncharacterized protein (TIRG00374 family)
MKRMRFYLLSIGVLLYLGLLSKLDLTQVWSLLRQVNLPLLVAAIVVGLPEILFKALRFRSLAKPETHLTAAESVHIYLSGQPMALVTPGKLGDVTRVWLFKRSSKRSTPECLAVHTSDKVFDFSALAILGSIGLLGWVGHGSQTSSALTAAGGVLAGLSLAVALMNPGWFKPLVKLLIHQWVPPEQADPLKHHGREFLDKLKNRLTPNTKRFFLSFFFSLAAWESTILRSWVCSLALGIQLPWGLFMLGAPLVILTELLPISILGFGPREATLILLFASSTLSPEALLSFSFLSLLAGPVATAVLGLPSALQILRENRETSS